MNAPIEAVSNPLTLGSIALAVGAIIRILKTKAVGDWLDALPRAWLKRIPKRALPWLALALGVVLAFVDLTLNEHLHWKAAIVPSFAGVLAGAAAVGGHETIAKLLGSFAYKPKGPIDAKGPAGPDPDAEKRDDDHDDDMTPPGGTTPLVIGAAMLLLAGCAPSRAEARGAVLATAEAVRVGDETCAEVAIAKRDVELARTCTEAYRTARASVVTAAESVDAWNEGAKGNVRCAISRAAAALGETAKAMRARGATLPRVIDDALVLTSVAAGGCS